MTDELVERLLDWPYQGETMAHEAADRIEALTAERDGLLRCVTDNHVALCRAEAAEAERDRLREAGSFAAKSLRIIAGMDLMAASAVAYYAARKLEAALKGETNE